jgi:uncharacterized protein
MFKKQFKLFFALFLLFFAFSAGAYYNPGEPQGHVNDYTNLLSTSEKENLENKLSAFKNKTSTELAIVIINSLGEDTIEGFAIQLFEDWGIGTKENDNGVLLLIALEEKKLRIEVGYGLEGALTDLQSGQIVRNTLTPAFKSGQYYQGIDTATNQIISAVKGEEFVIGNSSESNDGYPDFTRVIFIIGFILLQVLVTFFRKTKSIWQGGVLGIVIGVIIGLIKVSLASGIIFAIALGLGGLLLDYIASNTKGGKGGKGGMFFGGRGFGGGSSGGFGGFGGGRSGGGGSSGSW